MSESTILEFLDTLVRLLKQGSLRLVKVLVQQVFFYSKVDQNNTPAVNADRMLARVICTFGLIQANTDARHQDLI